MGLKIGLRFNVIYNPTLLVYTQGQHSSRAKNVVGILQCDVYSVAGQTRLRTHITSRTETTPYEHDYVCAVWGPRPALTESHCVSDCAAMQRPEK